MYIYKITNIKNGKKYIGQTIRCISSRWSEHKFHAKNGNDSVLYRAIRKHGVENFHIEIVDTALNQQELDKKESKWIFDENCLTKNGGYNQKTGGEHCTFDQKVKDKIRKAATGRSVNAETKRKISKSVSELWKNDRYRKSISSKLKDAFSKDEYKQKMSKIRKNIYKEDSFQKKHKARLLESHSRPFEGWRVSFLKSPKTGKRTLVFEEKIGAWENITPCSLDLGLSISGISSVLLKKRKKCYNYCFLLKGEG